MAARARLALTRARRLAAAALLLVAAAAAAVEVNRAGQAELETVRGIGPAVSTRILAERAKKPFADWRDLMARVKGVGPRQARLLSAAGLTVDGAGYVAVDDASAPPSR